MYVGSARGLERTLVPPTGIPTYLFPMAPPGTPRGLALLPLATVRSVALLGRVRPRVTFATGGYVSVPAVLASSLSRVPSVLFLPDVVPGKAVKALVPLASRIAVSTEDSLPYLPPNKTVVTGYPVRPAFLSARRESARARFNLPEDATVLLVWGASLGARSINEALAAGLPKILEQAYVVHVSGEARLAEAEAAAAPLSPALRERYRLHPFLHESEMADALAAADLSVSRSGASSLGELAATGTPAVLVPLPMRHVHQQENAAYLARHGAAVVLPNEDLDRLPDLLRDLLGDRAHLETMSAAARSLARPNAAATIADLIVETAA